MGTAATPTTNSFVWIKVHDDVSEYPFSDSLGFLTVVVVAYLAYVLKIGPDLMKNREPFKLKNALLIYNASQVIISSILVILLLRIIIRTGLIPATPPQDDPEIRGMMASAIFLYFLAKLSELLDTIFFVLRKKSSQVTFLHVYHHASVIYGTWAVLFYSLNQTAVYSFFINSLVHVVMYFYYFMSALGPENAKYITYKKHITTFQLVQFVTVILHMTASLYVTIGEHTILGLFYAFYSSFLFFTLFLRFYLKTYKKSSTKNKVATNGSANNSVDTAENEKEKIKEQ